MIIARRLPRTLFRASQVAGRPAEVSLNPIFQRRLEPAMGSIRSLSSSRALQQVIYRRFGDSGGGGSGNRWRPFRDGKWDTPSKLLAAAAGTGSVYYVWHLEKVEETGRWRFIDVSIEREKQIGREADQDVLQEYRGKILPPSHPLSRRVTNVAARIIEAAKLGQVKGASKVTLSREGWDTPPSAFGTDEANFGGTESWETGGSAAQQSVIERLRQEWEVIVIKDDKTPNAFVTGGGKIFVFTGILPIAQNDDGIATVIGHEIAHQVQRHSAEKMSGMKVFGALVLLLEILGLDIGVSRVGLTFLMTLPNSRTMESEADNVGLRLMAQACYDPRESVKMWARMSELEQKQGGSSWFSLGSTDFFQTHPANAKRIKALEGWIPSAMSIRSGSSCSTADGHSVGDELRSFVNTFGKISGL